MSKVRFLPVLFSLLWGFSAPGQPTSPFGVDYHIRIRLAPAQRMIRGQMTLAYRNQGHAPLSSLYFLAYPNAFSSKETPYAEELRRRGKAPFHTARPADMGFLDSLAFTVNDKPVTFRKADPFGEIWEVKLPHPLQPGESVTLKTPFRVKLPFAFSRFGFDPQDSLFQFPYCYPRLAGRGQDGRWRLYPYSEQQEFFGAFARYDVSITVPAHYTVLSTGRLQNPVEKERMDRLDAVTRQGLDTAQAYLDHLRRTEKGPKTLRFVQDSVIDFAWFASPRYLFLQKRVVLDHGQPVHVMVAFPPRYYDSYREAPEWAEKALRYYSKRVGPWPFDHVSVVGGTLGTGGGMEYPLITLIGGEGSEGVVVHEVGHNWFQMMLATDERQHPWMDEGLNSFYDKLEDYETIIAANADTPVSRRVRSRKRFQMGMQVIYAYLAANRFLTGPTRPAAAFPPLNYGVEVYGRVPTVMKYLEGAMGRETFDRAMHEYFRRWKFRHPEPENFEAILTQHDRQAASVWPIFHDLGIFNGRIRKVDMTEGGLTVHTKGWPAGVPTVVKLYGAHKKKMDTVLYEQWTRMPGDGILRMAVADSTVKRAVGLTVNEPGTTLQVQRRHTIWHFPSSRNYLPRLIVSPITVLDRRPTIWWLPLIGYNVYDGFMVGSMLANPWLTAPAWEWTGMAWWGFGSKDVVGNARLRYHWRWKRDRQWHHAFVGARVKRFHYDAAGDSAHGLFLRAAYRTHQLMAGYEWKTDMTSPYTNRIEIRGVQTDYDRLGFERDPADSSYRLRSRPSRDRFLLVRGQRQRGGPFLRSGTIEAIAHPQFVRLTSEYEIGFPLRVRKRRYQSLHVRLYAGRMWAWGVVPSHFYLRLPASLSSADAGRGLQDFTFDHVAFDRSGQTALGSRQIFKSGGYFKTASGIGKSRQWVAALNVSSPIPVGPFLPVRVFFDAGMVGDSVLQSAFSSRLLWMAGLTITPLPGIAVHVPLAVSEHYRLSYQQQPWWGRITFEFDLHQFDPTRLVYGPYRVALQQ